MTDPLLTEDFQPELAPLEITCLAAAGEGVGGGAETNHRLPGVQELGEICQMLVRKLTETRANDEQVCVLQRLGATDVLLVIRIDVARLFVRGEKHDAIEAVLLRQNLRQHRHGFLGAVFLISRHEHDFFTVPRPARIRGDFEIVLRGSDRA